MSKSKKPISTGRHPNWLVGKEIQVKIMTKYHFTLGTLAKTKKKDNSTEQDVKKKKHVLTNC